MKTLEAVKLELAAQTISNEQAYTIKGGLFVGNYRDLVKKVS